MKIDARIRTKVLIEALPYIQKFRSAIVVIKLGGSAMEEESVIESILRDIVLVEAVGINPVVVHGGGKEKTQALNARGIQGKFVQGLRITSAEAVQVVQQVLDKEINPKIVAKLDSLGSWARGISGTQVFKVKPQEPLLLPDNTKVDLGYVGDVVQVKTSLIRSCIDHQTIPVVSPLGSDNLGQTYNINSDIAAMELAVSLQALKLIYLTDVPGVLLDPNDKNSVISTIESSRVDQLINQNIISGGMIPKIRSAVSAVRKGVGQVQFIDGCYPHSLLLELFTDAGVGTLIIP